ncbi:unnamed protein product [Linum tenue]|uniref:F-box domain-containing protein n=2 Tax=Linum tenue TaxID=586396 RepID=A0AAV0MMR9_9ROSI|nr:unnamed protein product [Linum tenue]
METRKKRRVRPQANPPISKLGDDALIEILIRLPNPRYACRCKCVCKRWRSLMSSPAFNRGFASHFQGTTIMKKLPPIPSNDPMKRKSSIIMSFLPQHPLDNRSELKVLDCFKDLLLCGFWDFMTTHTEMVRTFLVCNPFTEQWLALPVAPDKPKGCRWTVSRLVCEPRISCDLDLGPEGGGIAVYSEYRFRVLTIYQDMRSIKLDMFCSESGEWTKEALILDGYRLLKGKNVWSCNGELFWSCVEDDQVGDPLLASVNAFCLDMPIDIYACPLFEKTKQWDLSISQGALHVIVREIQTEMVSVWRREEDGRSWMMQCEGSLKTGTSSSMSYFDLKYYTILNTHPERPEVVYFKYQPPYINDGATLSYDLKRGELEYVGVLRLYTPHWTVFQPRVSCWPTPIPRYKELRGIYDGHMSWFRVPSNNNNSPNTARQSKRKRSTRKQDSGIGLIAEQIEEWQSNDHRVASNKNSLGTAHRKKCKRSTGKQDFGVGLIAEPIDECQPCNQGIAQLYSGRRWLRVK